jgi:hypothetical protein
MFEIYTEAQPILNIAGSTQYQISSAFDVLRKLGVVIKMPKKLGMTRTEPMKYQVIRLPPGQSHLSELKPTIGVVIPSVIYPDKIADAVTPGLNPTTYYK